jgi:hypothetical protein
MTKNPQPEPRRPWRCVGTCLPLLGVLLALPACSSEQPPMQRVYFLEGKVTYKGEPVIYGKVLLYSPGKSLDPKSGKFVPVAFGEIKDGAYKVPNAPAGHLTVCVATDPDTDPMAAVRPTMPGVALPKANPGEEFGGPPKEAPKGLLKGPPKEGDPKGPPPIPRKVPGGFLGPPEMHYNPMTQKMTESQKGTLREIHARYGIFGKSPLNVLVKEGEPKQTFDLKLK